MNRYDFYKERYYKELDRKDQIDKSINVLITIITIMSSVVYYFGISYDYDINSYLTITFSVFLLLTIMSVIMSVFYIIRCFNNSLRGFSYMLLPKNSDLEKYYEELREYYRKVGRTENEAQIAADDAFETEILQKLIER